MKIAGLEENKFTLDKKSKTEERKSKVKVSEQQEVIEEHVAKNAIPKNPFGLP